MLLWCRPTPLCVPPPNACSFPQVNASLVAERQAKRAAETDRALVQIVLDAKQRLADALREVGGLGWRARMGDVSDGCSVGAQQKLQPAGVQ